MLAPHPSPSPDPSGQGRRRIRNEPRWRPLGRYTSGVLTPQVRAWLTDNSSLTARLMASGQGEFSVVRLFQGWEVPLRSESRLLAIPSRQVALVREVALLLGSDAVVFARSVFPVSSLVGALAHLRRLQNESLGAILFRHPGMRRSPFELALMPGNSDYLPGELQQSGAAWGRRSRFEIEGKRLMVSEVFLRAFIPWSAALPAHHAPRPTTGAAFMPPNQ
ncbi:MAG: chorismate lyase [Halioglobus sp.]